MFFKSQILKFTLLCILSFYSFTSFSQIFTDNIPGTRTFTVPCDVTSITIEAWGAGGGGQSAEGKPSSGGGGSGGGYVKTIISVSEGATYDYFIGTGGSGDSGNNGTDTWFISSFSINAIGGIGAGPAVIANNSWGSGANALIVGNIGGVLVSTYGGNGANATSTYSGGGGSSAGLTTGNNAIGINGGVAPADGYVGAEGISGRNQGINGSIGSGGSGGRATNGADQIGGFGGNGQIRITYTSAFQTYCAPSFTTGVEPITNVTFAGINNTTTNALGGASLESFCEIGTVVQGSTNTISLQGNTDGNFSNYFTVFIDWDQDGVFGNNVNEITDVGIITNSTGKDFDILKTISNNIIVPTAATLGNTRMRVMKRWNSYSPDACQTGSGYGQAEDYTINVIPAKIGFSEVIVSVDWPLYSTENKVMVYSSTGVLIATIVNGYDNSVPFPDTPYNATINLGCLENATNYYIVMWDRGAGVNGPGDGWDSRYSTILGEIPNITITSGGATVLSNKGVFANSTTGETVYFEVSGGSSGLITWVGSVNSDWNNASNWTCGGVPTGSTNVLIPSSLASGNFPVISSGAPGYVNNLVIQNNSAITLEIIDNYIEIYGVLTLNGKIDLNSEAQLIQTTGSDFDAASTGSIEIDQQGTGNSFRYNYWSSPVNSRGTKFTIDEVLRDGTDPNSIQNIDFGAAYAYADVAAPLPIKLSTYWMYVLRNSNLGYSAWFRVGNTGEVLIGEGYTMKGSNTNAAEQNYTFVGKPNNGTINLPVSANNEYLVGNPYPSAIDSWQFIDDNSPFPLGTASIGNGGTLIFWEHYGGDTHNLRDYQGGYATLSKGGSTPASSNVPAGVSILGSSVKGAPERYIPVGQAFFVDGSATGGDIQFNNGQRIFVKESSGNSIFMKSSSIKSKIVTATNTDLRPKFRIGFDAPAINHRQLLLTIDENTTDAIDWGYDAEIYDIINDDMYWMIDAKKYVIQATNTLSLDKEIPLGIETKEGGNIRIMVDKLENVAENTSIYIKDNLTGETYDITNQAFEINLEAGEYQERFVLTFQPRLKTLEEVTLIEGVHIFMNNTLSELQLNRIVDTEIVDVNLFNYLGQQVKTWNIKTDNRFISLPIQIAAGVYIAQVNTAAGLITKKIIIE